MAKKPKREPKPSRSCIFCGGRPVTREHIWSEWTYHYIPRLPGSYNNAVYGNTAGIIGLRSQRKISGEVNTKKIRAVCAKCNNEWMSAVENAAKPYLIPLFLGMAGVIPKQAQKLLATWVVMKCMVLEYDHSDDIVSRQSERDHIRLHREPPPGWNIWFALQRGHKWRTGWTRVAACLGSAPKGHPVLTPTDNDFSKNTQAFTLGFRRLAIHANYTRVVGLKMNPNPVISRNLRRIWPAGDGILWPCTQVIPDIDVDGLAIALSRMIDSLKWNPARGGE